MWPVQLVGAEPPVRSGTLGSPSRAASQEQAYGRATPALKWQARPTFQRAQNSWALFRPAWAPTGCQTQLTALRRRLQASPKADSPRHSPASWQHPSSSTGQEPCLACLSRPSPALHHTPHTTSPMRRDSADLEPGVVWA